MATIKFRVRNLDLYEPVAGPTLDDVQHIASVRCPRCGEHIAFVAEVSITDLTRRLTKYCHKMCEAAALMVGEADEYFEQTSGRSYRRSKQQQMLQMFLRAAKQCRDEFDVDEEGA